MLLWEIYIPHECYHVKNSFQEGLKCVWIYDSYICMFSVVSDERLRITPKMVLIFIFTQVTARNQLESYTFGVKQAAEEAAAGKLTEDEKKMVLEKCKAVLNWLDCNTLAEKDEYEDKLKGLQREVGPIMVKLHQGSGGSGAGSKGPTVEEVDQTYIMLEV